MCILIIKFRMNIYNSDIYIQKYLFTFIFCSDSISQTNKEFIFMQSNRFLDPYDEVVVRGGHGVQGELPAY